MIRHSRPALLGTLLALFLLLIAATMPAAACGCGAYIPDEGEVSVNKERALIRWDGAVEDIILELSVEGESEDAALILPVPSPATVQLAERGLFEELEELTRPRVEYFYSLPAFGGAGAPEAMPVGAAVTLLERQTLGPFDVSTLAATDAAALAQWLETNGYRFQPELAEVLQSYVDDEWYYVAVRLTPGAGEDALGGVLEPLRVTFESDVIVYPMKPSALAEGSLEVTLYILAEHRVEQEQTFGSARVAFADWVDPESLADDALLAEFVPRTLFLTKIENNIWEPDLIDDDYVYTFAPADEIYHDIDYVPVYDIAGIPIALLLLCLLCLACLTPVVLVFGFGVWLDRRRRREHAARPVVVEPREEVL